MARKFYIGHDSLWSRKKMLHFIIDELSTVVKVVDIKDNLSKESVCYVHSYTNEHQLWLFFLIWWLAIYMWEKNELSSLSYYSKLFFWSYFKNRQRWQLITETKREKTPWAFLFQKYSKIWSVSHFIKYKPHISEEWQQKDFNCSIIHANMNFLESDFSTAMSSFWRSF